MEYVALDFETANGMAGGACALGMVRFDEDGRELDSWYSLLCPRTRWFDPRMSRVHGLSSASCLAAPTFPERWEEISSFIAGDLVCAHNAAFDMGVLRSELASYGLSSVPIDYVCTCSLARRIWRGLPSYRLSALVAYLDLADYRAHHALEDAEACGRLFHRECVGHLADRGELERYLAERRYLPRRLSLEEQVQA